MLFYRPVFPSGLSGAWGLPVTISLYLDEAFSVPVPTTTVIYAFDTIYLAAFAPNFANVLVVRVDQCVASSTDNRTYNVPLVSGGCAVSGDVTVLWNGNATESRISINTLRFNGQSSLYIFCDVRLCLKTDNCSQCNLSIPDSGTKEMVVAVNLTDSGCYSGGFPMCRDCAGSCSSGPCYCPSGLQCIPTTECTTQTNECCPSGLYWDSSNTCCTGTPQCHPPCAADEVCNAGSCKCSQTIYQNQTISDMKPPLVCSDFAVTVSFSKCLLTYLNYDLTSMRINNNNSSPDCNLAYDGVQNGINVRSIETKIIPGYCGNVVTYNSTVYIISNNVTIDPTESNLTVGQNPLSMNFTCEYGLTSASVSPPAHPSGISGTGSFDLVMVAYKDADNTIFIQDRDVVQAGSDIYLAVYAPHTDGEIFLLRVDQCVASSTNNRTNSVPLVSGGCAVTGNVSVVVYGNGKSLETRIRVNTLNFRRQSSLYIYCDVRICAGTSDCSQCDSSTVSSLEVQQVVHLEDVACYNGTGVICEAADCAGTCVAGIGCICADSITSCIPTTGCPLQTNDCCPSGYQYYTDMACCTDAPICNPSCVLDEICNAGTCECDKYYYMYKTLADVMPSVDCGSDTGVITLSISKCLLVSLIYDYTSLRINHNSSVECSSTYTDTVNGTTRGVIQDKIGLSSCGNVITVNTTTFVIQNSLTIDPGVLYTSRPWLKTIWRNFSCAYSLSRPPITLGTNSLPLRVAAYSDPQYAMAILETDTFHTGDIIYLVLTASASLGIDSTLRVEQCVASSTDNRTDSVPLVSGGCADAGVVITENGISLESRLSINTVNFIGYPGLYIFCNVRLCIGTSYCSQCSGSNPSLDMALMQTIHFKAAACYSGNMTMCGSCGGSCDMGSCFCADGLESCVPTAECLSQTNGCCPSGYYYDANHTCCSDAVFCNPACAADEICTYGTCQCEKSFYRGFMADMKPSVQCDVDIATLSVSKCLLTYLGYDSSSLHFNDPLSLVCNNSYETTENDRKMENLEGRLIPGWCNNVLTYDNGTFFTTNSLNIDGLTGNGSLITVEPYSMSFSCPYNPFLGFVTAIVELTGPFGEGPYAVIMAAYKDPKYTTMLSLKESVSYSDVIYLSFVGLSVNVSWLVVRVDQCVASTSDNRTNAILLLSGGVPVTDKLEVLENEVSLQSRMMVNTSSFDGYDAVFLFCDVELCNRDYHCCQCDTTSPLPTQVKLMVPFKGRYFQVTPVWIFL
ncbi:uncharacterized protein [Hyperolius riggenbachi]|uniref:uncharacterized protein n=1 Tax=Hyperolius riggenbachi TaxID=752182 RepID=UPI0035A2F584